MALVSESSCEFRDNFHMCHMKIWNMSLQTLKCVLKMVVLGQVSFTYIINLLTEATHQNIWKYPFESSLSEWEFPTAPCLPGWWARQKALEGLRAGVSASFLQSHKVRALEWERGEQVCPSSPHCLPQGSEVSSWNLALVAPGTFRILISNLIWGAGFSSVAKLVYGRK